MNSQKANDIVTSVERWIKQIQDDGGRAFFKNHIDGDLKSFVVAWCTGFQLRVSVRQTFSNLILLSLFTAISYDLQ